MFCVALAERERAPKRNPLRLGLSTFKVNYLNAKVMRKMAKGFKTGGRDFKAGQIGNPKGRTPMPDDIRTITRSFTPTYIKGVIAKLSLMKPDDLVLGLEMNSFNSVETMVANIIKRAIVEGDHSRLNFLLDRTIGKVVEERRVKLESVVYKTTIQPDGGLIQELMRDEFGDPEANTLDVEAIDNGPVG